MKLEDLFSPFEPLTPEEQEEFVKQYRERREVDMQTIQYAKAKKETVDADDDE